VVGPVVQWRAGGLLVQLHCYGERKIACAEGAGVPPWTTCYTGSARDLPMLALARPRVLVCPSDATRREVLAALGDSIEVETWDD
jgi:phosphoserine phosphatase